MTSSCLPASVVSVVGDPASGKSTIVSALEYLQTVARGRVGVDQMRGGEVAAISQSVGQPCVISIEFDAGGRFFQYGLQLEFSSRTNLWQIGHEWLQDEPDSGKSSGLVFSRDGSQVKTVLPDGSAGDYELDPRMFVLSTFVAPHQWHPVCQTRRFLSGVLVLSDQLSCLGDRLDGEGGGPHLWSRGGNFGAWVAAQMSNRVELYPALANSLKQYLPAFRRLDVLNDKHTGRHLAAVFDSVGVSPDERFVPVGLISGTERLVLLGCLMLAVCKVSPDVVCIWDDFDRLSEVLPALAGELGLAYAQHGQLVAFQRRNRKLFTKCMISLSKGKTV